MKKKKKQSSGQQGITDFSYTIYSLFPENYCFFLLFEVCFVILLQYMRMNNIKGIVSRDWGELQMIPVDSSEVFSIAGSYLYSFLTTFSCLNL